MRTGRPAPHRAPGETADISRALVAPIGSAMGGTAFGY